MNPIERVVFGIWVAGTLLTSAVNGTLLALIGAAGIACLVRHYAKQSLDNRMTYSAEREIQIVCGAITQVKMNAAAAKSYYEHLRAITPKNAPEGQLKLVEDARKAMNELQNNPLFAEQLEGYLAGLKTAKEPAILARDIRWSSNLIGLGTFFAPIAALLMLGAYKSLVEGKQAGPSDYAWNIETC